MSPQEIVTRYQNGESVRQLAMTVHGNASGGREKSIRAVLKAAGVTLRSRAEIIALGHGMRSRPYPSPTIRKREISPEEIVARYEAGETAQQITDDIYGRPHRIRPLVMAVLKNAGVKLRVGRKPGPQARPPSRQQAERLASTRPFVRPVEPVKLCECENPLTGSVHLGRKWCRRCGFEAT